MRRPLRIVGGLFGAIVVLFAAAAAIVYAGSERALSAPEATAARFDASGGDVVHGAHLAAFLGCADCHGADLGGAAVAIDPAVATLWAPNLTRGAGGIGVTATDADLDRAVRRGIGTTGRSLIVMPSAVYAAASDDDERDLIAYLRSVPSVDRATPARTIGPVGRFLLAAGRLRTSTHADDVGLPALATTPAAGTPEFGHYLAAIGGCMHCHGANLGGAQPDDPKSPYAPDLTADAGAANWTSDQFRTAMREGQDPSGHFASAAMPWKALGQMTDDELAALQSYLKSVPLAHAP